MLTDHFNKKNPSFQFSLKHTFLYICTIFLILCHSDRYVAEAKPLPKTFRPGYPGWSVHIGKFSSRLPRSR